LVTLKNMYKKLRMLVDLGCIFVGHGLKSDFRIISMTFCLDLIASASLRKDVLDILVPPDQVIDTVDIYFIPAKQR
jgi:PAB-dependent poly(A)-specific ribonuclease subunit 2